MDDLNFDLVVIGSGPGGYVAAIRAAQLGLKTACIEKNPTLGGTCLNVGCIPSKALLQATHEYSHAKKMLSKKGILVENLSFDLSKMMQHKDKVVSDLTKGIQHLFDKNNVKHISGTATIKQHNKVIVSTNNDEKITVKASNIIIATGSAPVDLPGITIDEKQVLTSTGALKLDKIPNRLAVVGAGYIGLEMASVWSRLGSKVTIVESLDRILPEMDEELSIQFHKLLRRQKIKFMLSTRITGLELESETVTVLTETSKDRVPNSHEVDAVLIAVGRRPFTDKLGLEMLDVKLNGSGQIAVDDCFRTSIPNVFAIGDVIAGPMLAHKAEDEGIAVAELISGKQTHINYNAIPSVIYTHPEIASVGKTEEQLKSEEVNYSAGTFPFTANGRARAMLATEGFVKILADAESNKVLGVHIMAADAGTMIAEAVLAIELGATIDDIAKTCHAHPTLNEAFKEAALDVLERAIHV